MLDDARPPVGKKPLYNLTALNLLSNHRFYNAVMGVDKTLFPHFLRLNIQVIYTRSSPNHGFTQSVSVRLSL